MEKFENIVWAIEYVYSSTHEQAKQKFESLVHALTVVASVEYRMLFWGKIYEVNKEAKVMFALFDDEGNSAMCQAEISNHKGNCRVNSCEIIGYESVQNELS